MLLGRSVRSILGPVGTLGARARATSTLLPEDDMTPLSMEVMRQHSKHPQSEGMRIASAQFLHNELVTRLANSVNILNHLPFGLSEMPSVRKVRELYDINYKRVCEWPVPDSPETELKFTTMLAAEKKRHSAVVPTVARGVYELKSSLDLSLQEEQTLSEALDDFFLGRISIRMIVGQHAESLKISGGRVLELDPADVADEAIQRARFLCNQELGVAPPVEFLARGKPGPFLYVRSHLHHMMFELLKNSMAAVVNFAQKHARFGVRITEPEQLPPIKLIVSQGKEDIIVKISDEGGGISRADLQKVWLYTFTTHPAPQWLRTPDSVAQPPTFREHFAGAGYGLPVARLFARYFGGDLQLASMDGYGTDAFLHVRRLGDRTEYLPSRFQVSPLTL